MSALTRRPHDEQHNDLWSQNSAEVSATVQPAAQTSYLNHFTDLNGWVQGVGLLNVRCAREYNVPMLQQGSIIYGTKAGWNYNRAGYTALPATLSADGELAIQIRARFEADRDLHLGMTSSNALTCGDAQLLKNGGWQLTLAGEDSDVVRMAFSSPATGNVPKYVEYQKTHDANFHVWRLVRDAEGYWSIHEDGALRATASDRDDSKDYKYLTVQGQFLTEDGRPDIEEVDYIAVNTPAIVHTPTNASSCALTRRPTECCGTFSGASTARGFRPRHPADQPQESCRERCLSRRNPTRIDRGCLAERDPTLSAASYTISVDMPLYLEALRQEVGVTGDSTVALLNLMLLGGDSNDDDRINIPDPSLEGARFGKTHSLPNRDPRADINDDGIVNILDLWVTDSNFGKFSPLAPHKIVCLISAAAQIGRISPSSAPPAVRRSPDSRTHRALPSRRSRCDPRRG